jgi:hypothetical protein
VGAGSGLGLAVGRSRPVNGVIRCRGCSVAASRDSFELPSERNLHLESLFRRREGHYDLFPYYEQ